MTWHNYPEGYDPSAYCRSCDNDFSGESTFDRHRTGKHEYTYEEGLKLDPPVEDGRRCKTEEEMIESGLRLMTEEEMNESNQHRRRIGFNVKMWFDPVDVERVRKRRLAQQL